MQLDNLKKELSPDEQEILLTFKKNKASFKDTTGTVMTVLALIAVMMLTLLVVHFTGIINRQQAPDEVQKLLQDVINKQNMIEHQNESILNNEDLLSQKERNLEAEMDGLQPLKKIDSTRLTNLIDTFDDKVDDDTLADRASLNGQSARDNDELTVGSEQLEMNTDLDLSDDHENANQEQDNLEQENQENQEQDNNEQVAQEQDQQQVNQEQDNQEQDNQEQDNQEQDNKEQDNQEQDNQEQDNQEQDNQEQDNQEQDNQEQDNQEQDNQEHDKQEQESQEQGNQEQDNQEQDNQEQDNQEQDNQEQDNQAQDNQEQDNQAQDNQEQNVEQQDNQEQNNQDQDNQDQVISDQDNQQQDNQEQDNQDQDNQNQDNQEQDNQDQESQVQPDNQEQDSKQQDAQENESLDIQEMEANLSEQDAQIGNTLEGENQEQVNQEQQNQEQDTQAAQEQDNQEQDQNTQDQAQATQDQATEDKATQDQATQATQNQATQDQATQDQTAQDQATQDQATQDQATQDQATQDQTAQDQATQDQATQDQATQDQATQDQATQDQATQDQATQDQATQDQATQDQATQDQATQDQTTQDQATQDQATQDQATQDQATQDQATQDQATQDQATQDQATQDQATQDQATQDQATQETQVRDPQSQATDVEQQIPAENNVLVNNDSSQPESSPQTDGSVAAVDPMNSTDQEQALTAQLAGQVDTKVDSSAEAAQQSMDQASAVPNTRTLIDYPEIKANHVSKPHVDTKQYRYVQLDNQLKVLIIHDKKEQRAQAALNVLAGSWDEPTEYPGLAHFLEHMLFQGSEMFPEEGHFERLIASGGGKTNAYTQATKTNYYFSISSDQFKEAMEVFSHFFIDPLLKEAMVEKEVNAVNSEYEIDVSGDGWKLLHLLSLISNDNHPMSRFTIGNNQSLLKEDIVRYLREFHQSHYSANLMALVVKSAVPLDDMEEWLRNSDFTKIPNNQLPKPEFKHYGFPISAEHLGSVVKYHINGHAKTLLFAYQLEDVEQYYEVKPMEFIDAIVKSKHQDGLYSYLIEKGLAVDIDAGVFQEGNGAFNFYLIQVLLPENEKGQQEVTLQIAQAITAYFNSMMTQFFEPTSDDDVVPTALLHDMWAEKQALADIGFRFLEDSASSPHSNIFHLSHNLNTYRPEEVLSADFLFKEYDGLLIYDYLTDLLDPRNMVIMIGDETYTYKSATENDDSISIAAFLDTGSQYHNLEMVQLSSHETSTDDVEYISDRTLNNRNVLYNVDWDLKRLTDKSLNYIEEVSAKVDAAPEDKVELSGLSALKLPQVNAYVPEDLAMKSLCTNQPQSKLRKAKKPTSLAQKTTDPFRFLPKFNDLESDPIYAKRLESFIQVDDKLPLFSSMEDCLKHERDYESENQFPHLIKKDIEGRTWWKLQRSYEIPAIYAGIKFETAVNMKSLRQETLLKLFNEYVQDTLREELQPSFDAGFKLGFDSSIRGVSLEMFGWSDKFAQFYEDVLTTLKGSDDTDESYLAAQEQRIQRAKASLQLSYQNTYEKRLYQQALSTFLPKVMVQNFYAPEDYSSELESIQFDDVKTFRNKMLENFRFTTFFSGNILRDEAINLIDVIQDIFHETTNHIQVDNHLTRVANIHGQSIAMPIISRSANEADPNGVTLNYYQIGHRDQKQYTIMNLLQSTFQNKAYGYLRTELQLGYVVAAQFRPLGCLDGAAILVQGTAQPPYIVNQHIEEFLADFGEYLENMEATEFKSLKAGALSLLRENIKSLQEEGSYMWDHIKSNDLAFEEKQIAASLMNQVTQEEVVAFYKKVFASEKHTGKISLQIYGGGLISQTMGLKNKQDFGEFIENNLIKETYSKQAETIAFNEDHFAQKIHNNYNCQYRITNI